MCIGLREDDELWAELPRVFPPEKSLVNAASALVRQTEPLRERWEYERGAQVSRGKKQR